MCKQAGADFFSLYASGDLKAGAIDDWIDTWHEDLDPQAKDRQTFAQLSGPEHR
jgi:hypothetical protein